MNLRIRLESLYRRLASMLAASINLEKEGKTNFLRKDGNLPTYCEDKPLKDLLSTEQQNP